MQVSVEQLEGLERRVTVQVPAATVDDQVLQRLRSTARQVRVDGFRPGKVPVKLVKRMYGEQVRKEVLNEVLRSSLPEALEQQQLSPIHAPNVNLVSIDEGTDFEYQATFEVRPELNLVGIAGQVIKRPVVEITEADVDAMIETLRKQRAEWHEVERAAVDGDKVTVSFTATVDGESFPGGSGDKVELIPGSQSMLPAFEQAVLGHQAGEEFEFAMPFPADHLSQDLAGKTAQFKVQIHKVEEPILPSVDEDFLKIFGITSGDVNALRDELRANMQRELEAAINNRVKVQVFDALLAANEIPLPNAVIEQTIMQLAIQAGLLSPETQPDEQQRNNFFMLFETRARRQVALNLAIAEIAKNRDLQIDPQRVQHRIETIAASYEDSAKVIDLYNTDAQFLQGVQLQVQEDQVVDSLLSEAQVEEQVMSFEELIRPARPSTAPSQEASA